MKLIATVLVSIVLAVDCLGQASAPAPLTRAAQVRGTIADPVGALVPGAEVTFDRQGSQNVVTADDAGFYSVDLPPGDYTMTVKFRGFKTYRRPLFRALAATIVVFDVALQIGRCGDMVIVPSTEEHIEEATRSCRQEDRFPAPSSDGVPFEVLISFGVRSDRGNVHIYEREARPSNAPVFVAYNVFSMRADKVTYDTKVEILQASGNVLVQDESGERHVGSISLRIADGRATQIY
jgi:hypothetical protein